MKILEKNENISGKKEEKNYAKLVFIDIVNYNLKRYRERKIIHLIILLGIIISMFMVDSLIYNYFKSVFVYGTILTNVICGITGFLSGKKINYYLDLEFKFNLFLRSIDEYDKKIDYSELVEISESKSINLIEKYFTRNDFDICWYQENKEDQEKTKQN